MGLKRAIIAGRERFLLENVKPLLEKSGLPVTVLAEKHVRLDSIPLPHQECLLVISASSIPTSEEIPFELLARVGGVIIYYEEETEESGRSKWAISPESSEEEIFSIIQSTIFEGKYTRKSPRIWTSIPVEYEVNGIVKVSEISSISYFGAFIRTVYPPERGERVKVRFSIGSRKIEAEGPVLYSTRVSPSGMIVSGPEGREKKVISFPGFAVFFEKIDRDSAHLIRKYVDAG